ncbi:tachylectin-related carbohydrate-binding protein [Actinoplanes sp. NPDC049265]|uniref:tachylectin-related carbohydrate-binding protein n=1 Tax=Actinoplanes sp. NPDC049265 TaxID=3363902 RepID=UPI00371F5493
MKTHWGIRLRTAAAAAAVAVPLVVLTSTGPASAADTWQCTTAAYGFAVDSSAHLWRYPFTAPGTNTAAHGTRVDLGGGWNTYGRVLGGPDLKVYGINANGLFRYRNVGTGWEKVDGVINWKISTEFTQYATAAWRDKITVDELGDFYAVDSDGRLRQWRYDEATRVWTINGRVLSTGWDRYDLIFAAGPGVIYGRTPEGKLFRSRYEPASQRWLQEHHEVGHSSWQQYTKGIFAIGGDTFYAPRGSNGELAHYRYREDNDTWPVQNRIAGNSGWQNFTNTTGTTNSCQLTDRHEPARPATPIQANSPIVALQRPASGTQLGPIEYVYADNIGRLRHAYQSDPDNFGAPQWAAVPTDDAFSGRPALVANPQGNIQLLAQNTNSDAWSFTRQPAPSTSWAPGLSLGGALKSRPAVVRLSDGTPAAFGLDVDGALWHRRYSGTVGDVNLLSWRKLGGSGLGGELVVVPGADRKATLFALDADGTPVTASYVDGTVTAWTELGGSGFTASPAAVKLPGQVLRVFARAADGQILTQQQTSGGAFPGTWTPVGTFTAAGAPAAVLDPLTGRLFVVARGTDNEIYRVFETAAGAGTWGDWLPLAPDGTSDPSVTEPTITEFTNGGGQTYLIAFRNQNDATRIYTRQNVSGKAAKASVFAAHGIAAPPR